MAAEQRLEAIATTLTSVPAIETPQFKLPDLNLELQLRHVETQEENYQRWVEWWNQVADQNPDWFYQVGPTLQFKCTSSKNSFWQVYRDRRGA
jgi:hypothetical protein